MLTVPHLPRRRVAVIAVAVWLSSAGCGGGSSLAQPLVLPAGGTEVTDDFNAGLGPEWQPVDGAWRVEDGVLRQQATDAAFPLALRTGDRFSDLDIAVEFTPRAGDVDASGGLVFRAEGPHDYYVVRANALEGNYRLYTFVDGQRSQIASADVDTPALGHPHTLRVIAIGDHIQAYLDGRLYLDHHDATFSGGEVGLWTKADSVTDFDDLHVRGF